MSRRRPSYGMSGSTGANTSGPNRALPSWVSMIRGARTRVHMSGGSAPDGSKECVRRSSPTPRKLVPGASPQQHISRAGSNV